MSEHAPQARQENQRISQIAGGLGRYAMRRFTTWARYRRERKESISVVDDWMSRQYMDYEAKPNIAPSVVRRFIHIRQTEFSNEDRPDFQPSGADRQLLQMFSDIVAGYEAGGEAVDVVWALNRATFDVEGRWDAKDRQYWDENRRPNTAMILARHALYDGLLAYAATETPDR